ncbi:MAG: site-specific DNA-methyltransferase [Eubacterium aggregans]
MQIETTNVKDLLPAEYNPRKDLKPGDKEYEKLKHSIEQFGYVEPVIWNETTGRVVGGHQCLKVLQDMGLAEVDCVIVQMDEKKEKALNVALNKISGEWDNDKLALLIADLQGADFDVSLTGFEPEELEDLFRKDTKNGVKEDDFNVEAELQKPTFSKAGDLWLLGDHRLVCGDSTKPETYELLMADKQANLVVTDPPYNVNYEGSAGKIKNDNMGNDAFYQFLFDAYTQMATAMADDASIYVFHANTEGLNFRKAFVDAGFYLSGYYIWKKQSLVLGRSPYQWMHEPVLYGWKKSGKHQWYTGLKETTIWEFDKSKKNGDHPTMKPIPLLAYPIMNSSMANSIVLDQFGGSGSTLIACEQTNRNCQTNELDEKFCDVIVNRYIEQVGSAEGVFAQRDGLKYSYSEVAIADTESAVPLV